MRTIGQSASYLLSQKYLKTLFVDNFPTTLIIFFRNFTVVLEKAKVRNKRAVDNNKVFGALLTDLSKAFDCICHDCSKIEFLRSVSSCFKNDSGLSSKSKAMKQNWVVIQ